MSVIEDTRQVLQDFLAPELRAISARLDALEQRFGLVEKRFDSIDRKFDSLDRRFESIDRKFERLEIKFEEVDRNASKRHEEMMASINRLGDLMMLQERVTRIETRQEMQKQ